MTKLIKPLWSKLLLAGLAALGFSGLLQSCGGAKADGPFEPMTGATTGYGNYTLRDTRAASGGQPGYVNSASTVHAVAGENVTAFEWASLSILDNHAKRGENVAFYAQANKYGDGPTWAAVSEVADRSGARTGLVAHEFDVWTSGPDTGNRVGIDVVLGDVKVIRGLGKSDVLEATSAVRIGANHGGKWISGVELKGRYDAGINTSQAVTGTALKLAEGQVIELSPGVTISSQFGRIVFTRNGEILLSL